MNERELVISKWWIIALGAACVVMIVYAVGWAKGVCIKDGYVYMDNKCQPTLTFNDSDDSISPIHPVVEYKPEPLYLTVDTEQLNLKVDGMACKLECKVQYGPPELGLMCLDDNNAWVTYQGDPIHNGDKLCQLWCKEKPKSEPKISCDKRMADAARRYVGGLNNKIRINGLAEMVRIYNDCKD